MFISAEVILPSNMILGRSKMSRTVIATIMRVKCEECGYDGEATIRWEDKSHPCPGCGKPLKNVGGN